MKAQVIVALSGVVVATIALIFTAIQVYLNRRQLRLNTDVNRGNSWLKLEETSRHYDYIHLKLRPGGEWTAQDVQGRYIGPKNNVEWATVEDYMGFFEHIKILLDRELIDKTTFKKLFAYRLRNIVRNPIIVEHKLKIRGQGWSEFIQLLRDLEIESPWYTLIPKGLEFRLPRPEDGRVLEARIRLLEDEFEAWREEIRRKDTIIMNLTEAMQAISPPPQERPSEPRESPVTATE
jgi:hypothetical protein